MKRMMLVLLALTATPGCGLVLSADDHLGGEGVDGGSGDAGSRDAAPVDADQPQDDAGEADSGTDGGAPPPPECTTSVDCGAVGLVQCIDRRCQFCATPDASVRTLRTGAALRPQVAVAFGTRNAGPPYVHVAAFQGAPGAASSWHRFEPGSATVDSHTVAISGGQLCGGGDPYDRVLGGSLADAGGGTMVLSYLGPRSDRTYWQFLRWYEGNDPDVAVYDCRPQTPTTLLGPIVPVGPGDEGSFGGLFVARWASDSGVGLISVEGGYGNEQNRATIDMLTRDEVTHVAHANAFVAVSSMDRSRTLFWRQDSAWASHIQTPGRTTDADVVAVDDDDYLLAYGVGDRIRLLPVRCSGTSCSAVGETADVRTDATSVDVVRIAMSARSMPLLLSVEQQSGSARLVMRALRPSRAPWDAPGGGRAFVIETAPDDEEIVDAQLVTTGTGATVRHAVAWLRRSSPSSASVLAQAFAGACEP